jgi:hypothetical protein
MSNLTIKHRAAAVRNTWSYGERLQRALAAQHRCQRLLAQLGLAPMVHELALAKHPARPGHGRRLG